MVRSFASISAGSRTATCSPVASETSAARNTSSRSLRSSAAASASCSAADCLRGFRCAMAAPFEDCLDAPQPQHRHAQVVGQLLGPVAQLSLDGLTDRLWYVRVAGEVNQVGTGCILQGRA